MKARLKEQPSVVVEMTWEQAKSLEHAIGNATLRDKAALFGEEAAQNLYELFDTLNDLLYEKVGE